MPKNTNSLTQYNEWIRKSIEWAKGHKNWKKNSLMSWIRFDFTMFLNDDVLCTLYAMNRDTFFCVCAVIAFHWWIHVVGGPSLRSTFHRTIIIHEREWKKNHPYMSPLLYLIGIVFDLRTCPIQYSTLSLGIFIRVCGAPIIPFNRAI